VALNTEIKKLVGTINVLIIGDGAMAFAYATVMKWENRADVRLLVKHRERLLTARSLGFDAELVTTEVQIPRDINVLILACDVKNLKLAYAPIDSELYVAHVARQSSMLTKESIRTIRLTDAYAYTPKDFARAVELISFPNFDLTYAQEVCEPVIPVESTIAFNRLRSLPRETIKYVFRRNVESLNSYA